MSAITPVAKRFSPSTHLFECLQDDAPWEFLDPDENESWTPLETPQSTGSQKDDLVSWEELECAPSPSIQPYQKKEIVFVPSEDLDPLNLDDVSESIFQSLKKQLIHYDQLMTPIETLSFPKSPKKRITYKDFLDIQEYLKLNPEILETVHPSTGLYLSQDQSHLKRPIFLTPEKKILVLLDQEILIHSPENPRKANKKSLAIDIETGFLYLFSSSSDPNPTYFESLKPFEQDPGFLHCLYSTTFEQSSRKTHLFFSEFYQQTLEQNREEITQLPWKDKKVFFTRLCSSLAKMHQKGILHRNLTAESISFLGSFANPETVVFSDLTSSSTMNPCLETAKALDVYALGLIFAPLLELKRSPPQDDETSEELSLSIETLSKEIEVMEAEIKRLEDQKKLTQPSTILQDQSLFLFSDEHITATLLSEVAKKKSLREQRTSLISDEAKKSDPKNLSSEEMVLKTLQKRTLEARKSRELLIVQNTRHLLSKVSFEEPQKNTPQHVVFEMLSSDPGKRISAEQALRKFETFE